MTKFSFEVPIKHLDDFDEDQDFIFSLSILYQNEEYVKYINKVNQEGMKTVWLDNSYNETMKADSVTDLVKLTRLHQARRVIAPDDPKWDTKQIKESFTEMNDYFGVHRIIVVVSSYEMFIDLQEAGAMNFAVSYWTRDQWSLEALKNIPRLHFLGLLDVPELINIQPASCDTSMPIKLALTGRTMRDWQKTNYEHIHTKDLGPEGKSFFEAEMTSKEIDLAKENIWTLRNALSDMSV